MAFLDNSGDIILDAVLTDTGRLRLAQGDGSFKITKFALGDDEINYGLYNKDHASGSAYYDLEILQTPVLEAFTNNTSNLNSKLMSIARTNLLFMPILKLNKCSSQQTSGPNFHGSQMYDRTTNAGAISAGTSYKNRFVVACDATTFNILYDTTGNSKNIQGVIQGYSHTGSVAGGQVRVDQGMDTSQISPQAGLDSDLLESQFIIELDYRLGRLARPNAKTIQNVNFIDDDNIASYYVADTAFVQPVNNTDATGSAPAGNPQIFDGPRGNSLGFRLHASTELQYSTYLFEQIGKTLTNSSVGNDVFGIKQSEITTSDAGADAKLYYIDTSVRVVGANTGFRIDIPVRYVKIQ